MGALKLKYYQENKDLESPPNSIFKVLESPRPRKETDGKTYQYGFNGQERDDEVKGSGNSVNFMFRMYDPRLGRFFAVDPLTHSYPYYTPYQFAGNTPIQAIDLEGLEEFIVTDYYNEGQLYKSEITVINDYRIGLQTANEQQLIHRSRVDMDANGDITVSYVATETNTLTANQRKLASGTDQSNQTNLRGIGTAPSNLGSMVNNGQINITTTDNNGNQVSNKTVQKNSTQTSRFPGVAVPANEPSKLNNVPAKQKDRRDVNGNFFPDDGAFTGSEGNKTPTGDDTDFQFSGSSTGSVTNEKGKTITHTPIRERPVQPSTNP
jgi:RHS repeat-associated protein